MKGSKTGISWRDRVDGFLGVADLKRRASDCQTHRAVVGHFGTSTALPHGHSNVGWAQIATFADDRTPHDPGHPGKRATVNEVTKRDTGRLRRDFTANLIRLRQ